MNPTRIVIAALVGGIAVFGWGAIAHMVLPVGEMGVGMLPDEDALVGQMKQSITKHGFYRFPGMEQHGKDMTAEEQKAWEKKYEAGPRGVVIFDPTGDTAMGPKMLGTEFASNVLGCLMLAIVLAHIPAPLGKRVMLATLMGVFAWLMIDMSYWNWCRFPTLFAVQGLIDQGVGGLIAGLAIALVLGKARLKHAGAK
jgi:hypothetical protein